MPLQEAQVASVYLLALHNCTFFSLRAILQVGRFFKVIQQEAKFFLRRYVFMLIFIIFFYHVL